MDNFEKQLQESNNMRGKNFTLSKIGFQIKKKTTAEKEGFEPTKRYFSLVFKTRAFDHSATPPL